MDFDRWYRRAKRKADLIFVQGIVIAIAAAVLGTTLANIGNGAGDFVQPFINVFALAPRLLLVLSAVLMGRGVWIHWRLHADPIALYERG